MSKSLWRLSGLTVWQLSRNAFAGVRRNDAIERSERRFYSVAAENFADTECVLP
jgi:hypothetical protein